jgi:hypothetical protein
MELDVPILLNVENLEKTLSETPNKTTTVLLHSPITIKIPKKETLIEMLKEEEKRRFSSEYQIACTAVKHIPNGWLDITAKMQQSIATDFGFDDEISNDIACNHLRRAQYMYPNDPEFKSIPVYVRENKANEGTLKVGDDIPNVVLYDMNHNKRLLHDLIDLKKINLCIASSAS